MCCEVEDCGTARCVLFFVYKGDSAWFWHFGSYMLFLFSREGEYGLLPCNTTTTWLPLNSLAWSNTCAGSHVHTSIQQTRSSKNFQLMQDWRCCILASISCCPYITWLVPKLALVGLCCVYFTLTSHKPTSFRNKQEHIRTATERYLWSQRSNIFSFAMIEHFWKT